MIVGIDHLIVAVDDVEAAMRAYRALGFEVHQGGEHPRFGTHNALVPLADGSYLELMGVHDEQLAAGFPPTAQVLKALTRENRLALFVLESDDLDADVAAIRERGVQISDPAAGERLRPDGERVAWRTAHPEEARLPFLIEDVTPRETRVALPLEGIGRWLRTSRIELRTSNDRWSATLEALAGHLREDGQILTDRGSLLVREGDQPLEFTRLVLGTWRWPDVENALGHARASGSHAEWVLERSSTLGAEIALVASEDGSVDE